MLLLWVLYLQDGPIAFLKGCSVSLAAMLKLNISFKDAKVCKSLSSFALNVELLTLCSGLQNALGGYIVLFAKGFSNSRH